MNNGVKIASLLAIAAFTVMACQLVSGLQEQVSGTRQTVEAAATKLEQGQELLGTAQAFTTQVGGQSLIPTAQALATQMDQSGILETAKAVATEQGSGILSTARAIATQQGPAALETVQAYATQFAQATPAEDIPLIDAERDTFFQSASLISYNTTLPFDQVLDFYKNQMPANGWNEIENEGFETATTAFLSFEKGGRKASVSLVSPSETGNTLVVIFLGP